MTTAESLDTRMNVDYDLSCWSQKPDVCGIQVKCKGGIKGLCHQFTYIKVYWQILGIAAYVKKVVKNLFGLWINFSPFIDAVGMLLIETLYLAPKAHVVEICHTKAGLT